MRAIIYESNAGHTKRYAEMLANEVNLPLYTFKQAKKNLEYGDDIIFMSWIVGGGIKDLKKATIYYEVKICCAVGVDEKTDENLEKIKTTNNIDEFPLFLLRGGFDISLVKGLYKFMIKFAIKNLKKEKEEELNEKDKQMLEIFDNKTDYVSKDNLNEIIEYYNNLKDDNI